MMRRASTKKIPLLPNIVDEPAMVGEDSDMPASPVKPEPEMTVPTRRKSALTTLGVTPTVAPAAARAARERAAKATEAQKAAELAEVMDRAKSARGESGSSSSLLARIMFSGMSQLVIYFGVGIAVYGSLEGWSPLDACYFMVVTATTVGYGDITPTNSTSRLFTCAYALLGTTIIIGALGPLVEAVLGLLGSVAASCVPFSVDTDDSSLSLAQVNSSISYARRYMRATLGPLVVLLIGVAYSAAVVDRSLVDTLYYSVVTMTTVGYGDVAPATNAEKAMALVYLPVAVTALANMLSDFKSISTRRAIRSDDHVSNVESLLLAEARGDPTETLTEAEFLVGVLTQHGLIDQATIRAIRSQFETLVPPSPDPSEPRQVDARTVFNQLVSMRRVRQTPPKGEILVEDDPGAAAAVYVDLSAHDGGYAQWYRTHWVPSVSQFGGK